MRQLIQLLKGHMIYSFTATLGLCPALRENSQNKTITTAEAVGFSVLLTDKIFVDFFYKEATMSFKDVQNLRMEKKLNTPSSCHQVIGL